MKSRKKGYTLLELLISLGIMTFIVTLIMTFFITNIKNLAKINIDSELQFHSQYILNFVSNKIMESRNVVLIKSDTKNLINGNSEYKISKMSLRYGELEQCCYIFEVRNNNIYYGNGYSNDLANIELGRYIKELKVSAYPDGETFAEANSLKMTLCLFNNGQEYEAEQIVYMRGSIK